MMTLTMNAYMRTLMMTKRRRRTCDVGVGGVPVSSGWALEVGMLAPYGTEAPVVGEDHVVEHGKPVRLDKERVPAPGKDTANRGTVSHGTGC